MFQRNLLLRRYSISSFLNWRTKFADLYNLLNYILKSIVYWCIQGIQQYEEIIKVQQQSKARFFFLSLFFSSMSDGTGGDFRNRTASEPEPLSTCSEPWTVKVSKQFRWIRGTVIKSPRETANRFAHLVGSMGPPRNWTVHLLHLFHGTVLEPNGSLGPTVEPVKKLAVFLKIAGG